MVGFLQDHPADILCLQELTSGFPLQTVDNTWQHIADSLDYEYRHIELPVFAQDSEWLQANVIFSKYPIRSSDMTWLYKPGSYVVDGPQARGYLEASIRVADKDLTVATTHLSYPNRTEEIHNLLHVLQDKKSSYILAGDFNAAPTSEIISAMTERLVQVGPDYELGTWPTKPFATDAGSVDLLRDRLDYIFCTPDIEAISSGILKTDVSDHLPVYMNFNLS